MIQITRFLIRVAALIFIFGCFTGLSAADENENVMPYADGVWTVHWYQVTQKLNMSTEPASMEDMLTLTESRLLTADSNHLIRISATDYTDAAKINSDSSHPWTFLPNYNGSGNEENVEIDISLPENAGGGSVNFYFSPPDWEYLPGVSAGTIDDTGVLVYTSRGWFEVMAKSHGVRPNSVNNSNITYIRLGADINQRDDQNNGTFFIYRAKPSLIIDGAKDPDNPGSPEECYKFVQWFYPGQYGGTYEQEMRFGPNDGLGLVGSSTAPLTEFTWKNTYIVGGNGYGIIATDMPGLTHNYENIFFIGPQFDYNIYGTLTLKDAQIIIEDPRYSGNNVISYEDVNGTPYTVTLNLASSLYANGSVNNTRPYASCYWGEVSKIKNAVLSGHTRLYKANGLSYFGCGIFQASTSGTISIDNDAVVEILHKNVSYGSFYETPFIQATTPYNLTVGERAEFTFVNDHRFSSGAVDYAYQFNIGNHSVVNLISNFTSGGTYLRFSRGLAVGENSHLDLVMKNAAATIYPIMDLNNTALIMSNGSHLNVSGNYTTGARINPAVHISDYIIESGADVRLINYGENTVLRAANVTVDDSSLLEVYGMGITDSVIPAVNVTSLSMDRVKSVIFYKAGPGSVLSFNRSGTDNMILTNMYEVKQWLDSGAVADPVNGVVSGEPAYNWSHRPHRLDRFNISAGVYTNGTIHASNFSVNNYHGSETLDNMTFSLSGKRILSFEGFSTSYVTLHWNDPNNTVNGGNVNYGMTVADDLDLDGLKPEYPNYGLSQWYSDASLTVPYDIYTEEVFEPLDLYGKWISDGIVFNLTYNGLESGDTHSNPSSFTVEDLPYVLSNASRDGYSFSGWFDDEIGGNQVRVIEIDSVGDKELWAQFDSAPIEYIITYAGLMESDTNPNPATFNITSLPMNLADPQRDGHNFMGWFDAETGGTRFTQINMIGDMVFWAIFDAPVEYDIIYNLDGGVNNASNPETYNSTSPDITLADPTKDGYIFSQWTPSDTIPTGSIGSKTFTAIWDANVFIENYDVIYDSGTADLVFGELPPESVYEAGSRVPVADGTQMIRVGWRFIGWDSSALVEKYENPGEWTTSFDGDGTESFLMLSQDVTLTARWNEITDTYRVYYDGNGYAGSVPFDSADYAYNENVTVSLESVDYGGYVFKGWTEKQDGTGTVYQTGDIFRITEEMTLYAQWAEIGGFDSGSGSSTGGLKIIDPVTEPPVPPDTPTEPPLEPAKPVVPPESETGQTAMIIMSFLAAIIVYIFVFKQKEN